VTTALPDPALVVLIGGRAFCGIGAGTGHRRRRHHSGTAADHVGRYRLLAERGVSTVFVSLPDLAGPDDVLRLAPVTAAFR